MNKMGLKYGLICVAVSFVWCLLTTTCANFLNEFQTGDFAIYSAVGMSIESGLCLYKDVFDHKGPLQYVIYALAHSTGCFKLAMFIFEVAAVATSLIYTCKISIFLRSSKRDVVITGMSLLMFIYCISAGGGRPETYSLPLTFVAIYMTLKAAGKRCIPCSYFFYMGVLIGAHFLLKANNAFITCGLLFCSFIIQPDGLKSLCRKIGSAFTGVTVPLLLAMIYFVAKDSLYDFFEASFLMNFKYAATTEKGEGFWGQMFLSILPTAVGAYFVCRCAKLRLITREQTIIVVGILITGSLNMMLGICLFYYYISYIPVMILSIILGLRNVSTIQFLRNPYSAIIWGIVVLSCFNQYIISAARMSRYTFCFNFAPQSHIKTKSLFYEVQSAKEVSAAVPEQYRSQFWAYCVLPQIYPLTGMTPCIKYCMLQDHHSKWLTGIDAYIAKCLREMPPEYIAVPCNYMETDELKGNIILKNVLEREYVLIRRVPYGLTVDIYCRRH